MPRTQNRTLASALTTALLTATLGLTAGPAHAADDGDVIPVGGSPLDVAVGPSGTVYTANVVDAGGADGTISAIDPTTNHVSDIDLDAGPFSVAVGPSGTVYTANPLDSSVSVIDPTTEQVTTIDLGAAARPTSVAVDSSDTVYTANNDGTVSVVDPTTRTVTDIDTGGRPVAVGVDPESHTIYTANSDDTLFVIDPTTKTVTTIRDDVPGLESDVAVDPHSHVVYTANQSGSVSVVDPGANAIAKNIAVDDLPHAIAVGPAGLVYTANLNKSVTVIDPDSGSTTTIPIDAAPYSVAAGPMGTIYVADAEGGTVSVIVPITGLDPSISGLAQAGHTVTAHPGPVMPADANLAYQWNADGSPIAGETDPTLKLTRAQVGAIITVTITATADGHHPQTESSDPTPSVRRHVPRHATLTLDDRTPHRGQTITVTGRGFTAGNTYSVSTTNQRFRTTTRTVTADRYGEITTPIGIDAHAPRGALFITTIGDHPFATYTSANVKR